MGGDGLEGDTIETVWMRTGVALMALAAGLSSPGTLQAQVELGPRLGIYLPSGSVVKEGSSYPGGPVEKQQVPAPLLGVQALIWPKRWIGIEAAAVLSPSMVAVTDGSGTVDKSSTVVLANIRAIVPVNSRRAMWSFNLGAGIGLVTRSGAVWEYQSGTTAQTWVLSFGGQTALSETLHMRFEFEDNISTAQFDQGLPTATQGQQHNDFALAIALEFRIGGQR